MIICDPKTLLTPCTILIIDDDGDVRRVMTDIVEHFGYRGVPLRSGMEAIDHLVSGGQADGAIVDLWLPAMGGRQIVRALRQLKPSLAALMVSGDSSADDSDFDSDVLLLLKPFGIAELDAALHLSLVARARRCDPAKQAAPAIGRA